MKTPDIKRMEKMRDLQTELGAILDRFYVEGCTPNDVMAVLSVESELWLRRDSEDRQRDAKVDPHHRPHPPFGGMASHPLLGSPGSEPANT